MNNVSPERLEHLEKAINGLPALDGVVMISFALKCVIEGLPEHLRGKVVDMFIKAVLSGTQDADK